MDYRIQFHRLDMQWRNFLRWLLWFLCFLWIKEAKKESEKKISVVWRERKDHEEVYLCGIKIQLAIAHFPT